MSNRWPGGIIRKTPVTPAGPFQNGAASGVWSLADAAYWTKQGLWPLAGNTLPAIEDYFSTYLYTGNGSTQTITNGIDLAGKGGMVWIKNRNASSDPLHYLNFKDGSDIVSNNSNNTSAKQVMTPYAAFNSDGFFVNALPGFLNNSGVNYASWTFRKAPKFFDVVTYTGNGANRNIAHTLGIAPGMILVKRTDIAADWQVYHRSNANTQYQVLNSTAGVATGTTRWNSTTPTATEFTVGTDATVNASGATYVAYLYAHDATSDGVIQCGKFTTDGSGNATVDLGWEPQWVLTKNSNAAGNWIITDNMRGMPVSASANALLPNSSAVEGSRAGPNPTATGFTIGSQDANRTMVYIAIRRGPMRTPTLGTSVFMPSLGSSSGQLTVTTNFPSDLAWFKSRGGSQSYDYDRLRGNQVLLQTTTDAESTGNAVWDSNTTFRTGDTGNFSNWAFWNFRRAPGFFDEVCYTGTGVTRTQAHNLGVVPELIIAKRRSASGGWSVFLSMTPSNYKRGQLNGTDTPGTQTYVDGFGLSAQPTSTVMNFDSGGAANESGTTYVSYLFASCPGVSKVGSYTGNGSSQTINCAFAAGARFVMIKRTDSTGDWYVWDTARGIVAGNDPHLSLNTTAAEVTTDDSVDTDSSGFVVNQDAATNVNVNGATYIYFAVS